MRVFEGDLRMREDRDATRLNTLHAGCPVGILSFVRGFTCPGRNPTQPRVREKVKDYG